MKTHNQVVEPKSAKGKPDAEYLNYKVVAKEGGSTMILSSGLSKVNANSIKNTLNSYVNNKHSNVPGAGKTSVKFIVIHQYMIQITINDDEEVEVKTTKGLKETEIATNAVVEIMCQLKRVDAPKYKLVLVWANPEVKLRAVKEIKDVMNFGLKEAKDCVDNCIFGNEVILVSGNKKELLDISAKFNNPDSTRVCIKKL